MSRADDVGRSLDATLAAARQGAGPVEVDGFGPLATELRERLEVAGPPAGERPGTVVETTGDLARIESAIQRVDDLGTVVLAGHPADVDTTIDLYADVHVRGLTLITVVPDPDEG